jgi:hypothetical protein
LDLVIAGITRKSRDDMKSFIWLLKEEFVPGE